MEAAKDYGCPVSGSTEAGSFSPEANEHVAMLARASRRAAEAANFTRAGQLLSSTLKQYPEMCNADTQCLELLLHELADRLEELSVRATRFSQSCEQVAASGQVEGPA